MRRAAIIDKLIRLYSAPWRLATHFVDLLSFFPEKVDRIQKGAVELARLHGRRQTADCRPAIGLSARPITPRVNAIALLAKAITPWAVRTRSAAV